MYVNWINVIGLCIKVTAFFIMVYGVLPKVYAELKSEDRMTLLQYRRYLLGLAVSFTFPLLPGIARSIQTVSNVPISDLSSLAVITNNVPYLAGAVFFWLIYTYKYRDK